MIFCLNLKQLSELVVRLDQEQMLTCLDNYEYVNKGDS